MDVQNIQAGDLRTKIRIQYKKTTGDDDFATSEWVDLGNTSASDAPLYIQSAWYPLGGSETWIAASVQNMDTANVIIRYNSSVNPRCRLIKDGVVYNIISPNDPDQHRHWLKFKASAAVNG